MSEEMQNGFSTLNNTLNEEFKKNDEFRKSLKEYIESDSQKFDRIVEFIEESKKRNEENVNNNTSVNEDINKSISLLSDKVDKLIQIEQADSSYNVNFQFLGTSILTALIVAIVVYILIKLSKAVSNTFKNLIN